MPAAVTIDFPHRDVAALRHQMARAVRVLGKSQGQAVRFGAWAAASSLGASTKVSKPRRPIREVSTTRRGVRKFQVTSYKQGSKREFDLYARDKREANAAPQVKIGFRGLAKASWMWGIKALGSARGSNGGMTKAARSSGKQHINVAKHLKGDNPSVKITNKLGYIMDALRGGPKDVGTAMGRAARQMTAIIDSKIPKGLFS